ncbi:A-kinase anchor protein 14 isoform X4 [Carettochelys insculpta]|uniref:A-kinase anchor protein 14 isoform X4 n=1 Tax=Carettochelys insculpta TaxID=44489 RepID=UPI003EBFF3CE
MPKSIFESCEKKSEKLSTSSKTFNGHCARTLPWRGDSSKSRNTWQLPPGRRTEVQQEVPLPGSLEHSNLQEAHPTNNSMRLFHHRDLQNQTTSPWMHYYGANLCSKTVPKGNTLPVEVFFILESNRLIHRPGQCRVREKWLKDIIESKRVLVDSITF